MINRITPSAPPNSYKTYSMRTPLVTHYRDASCVEVGCVDLEHGWVSLVDEATLLGQQQVHFIKSESGRNYLIGQPTYDEAERYLKKQHLPTGLEVVHGIMRTHTAFRFTPGQRCFTPHRTALDREAFFYVRPGDWRMPVNHDIRRHVTADDWLDDFANHQQKLADRINRG